MNKQQYHSVLISLAEHKAPAININLWPAIQSRIQMSQSSTTKGIIMNKTTDLMGRKLKPVFFLVIVVLLGVVFFALPSGRSLAQDIIRYFTRNETNVMPGTTSEPVAWVEQTPGVAAAATTPLDAQSTLVSPLFEAECGTFTVPLCSIDSIREMVNFSVFALAKLPESVYFAGATGGTDSVVLTYRSADQRIYMEIWEEPFTGNPNQQPWVLGAGAEIQNIQIGDVTGEYVKGSYNGNDNPPLWDSTIDLQWLHWVDHGIFFTLRLYGAADELGRDNLAALAAALTDGPVGENGQPVAETEIPTIESADKYHEIYPLTLAEAEELAGFTLMTPSVLPETLRFVGARFDEESKEVWVFYHYNNPNFPDTSDGLVLREQHKLQVEVCSLCGFIQGEYKPNRSNSLISPNALIENIQIGKFEGFYVEGIGWVASEEPPYWDWDPEPYRKRIRFQTDELAIEVWVDSYELTREDVIAITASLR